MARLVTERYVVQPTGRIHATLVALVRGGFVRTGEGDLWPVVFMTTVDIRVALCVELSPERVASLGTMVKGPRRIRHRHWEDWWGWECPLGEVREGFFDLGEAEQEDAIAAWYSEGLEWLAGGGLLVRKGG